MGERGRGRGIRCERRRYMNRTALRRRWRGLHGSGSGSCRRSCRCRSRVWRNGFLVRSDIDGRRSDGHRRSAVRVRVGDNSHEVRDRCPVDVEEDGVRVQGAEY
jgi:hypothetical protein